MLPTPSLSRRRLLKFASVSGLATVGSSLFYGYAPWLSDETQANRARDVFQLDQPQTELIRYATLAASGHNTQPWKFALPPGSDVIEIHPDYARWSAPFSRSNQLFGTDGLFGRGTQRLGATPFMAKKRGELGGCFVSQARM